MQTSTIVFNVAAVVALIAAFIALIDLMKHKTTTYGVVTQAPTLMPATVAPTPVPTVTPAA